jgi:hypothetical protein
MRKKRSVLELILTEASFFLVSSLIGAIGLIMVKSFNYFSLLLGLQALVWIVKIRIFWPEEQLELKVSKTELLILTLILIFCLINGNFYYSSLGVIRDYGIYVNSAVALVKENGLPFSSTSIFPGMGRAIFTGFSVSEQPIGYAAYLAIFFRLAGLRGIFMANVLLLFLSSSLLYFLAKRIFGTKVGVLAVMLFLSHYVTVYFSRQTLSENLFLFLFLFASYLFSKGVLENPDVLLSALTPIILSLFVRIDGILFLGSFIFASFLLPFLKRIDLILVLRMNKSKLILLLGLTIAFVVYFLLFAPANYRYLVILLKVLANLLTFKFKNIPLLFKDAPIRNESPPSYLNDIRHIMILLFYYNLLPFILLGVFSFFQKRLRLVVLAMTILALPSFMNLLAFTINPDQPWVLRRYWPVFVPLVFLLSSVKIGSILEKKQNRAKMFACLSILILINVFFSSRIFCQTLGRQEDPLLNNFAQEYKNSLVIFSPDYWNTFGRYAGILKFYYGLDTIWPVAVRPSDGEVLNSLLAETISIRDKINDVEKVSLVFSKDHLRKGNFIEWLAALIEYEKASKKGRVEVTNKSYQLESYFRIPAYQETWPPSKKEEPQEEFAFISF